MKHFAFELDYFLSMSSMKMGCFMDYSSFFVAPLPDIPANTVLISLGATRESTEMQTNPLKTISLMQNQVGWSVAFAKSELWLQKVGRCI